MPVRRSADGTVERPGARSTFTGSSSHHEYSTSTKSSPIQTTTTTTKVESTNNSSRDTVPAGISAGLGEFDPVGRKDPFAAKRDEPKTPSSPFSPSSGDEFFTAPTTTRGSIALGTSDQDDRRNLLSRRMSSDERSNDWDEPKTPLTSPNKVQQRRGSIPRASRDPRNDKHKARDSGYDTHNLIFGGGDKDKIRTKEIEKGTGTEVKDGGIGQKITKNVRKLSKNW